jgi:hygromycin-B 4-O-kinase
MKAASSTDQVQAFLASHFGAEVTDVNSIGHGEWSRAFAFRQGGADYILRLSASDEDFAKDRVAARYATPALPIPAVLDMGRAQGGFYAISERACGGYLDDLNEADCRHTLPSLFAAMDAARTSDISDTSGYGEWGADARGAFPSWRLTLLDVESDRPTDRVRGWRERLATSPTALDAFERGMRSLRRLVEACPEERNLVHSDLLNFNVLVADNRITGVIDWGCAMYGDFVYDVAWLSFWSRWYPQWQGIDFAAEASRHYAAIGLHVPDFNERLACYELHIALRHLAYWAFKGRWANLEILAQQTLELAPNRPRPEPSL